MAKKITTSAEAKKALKDLRAQYKTEEEYREGVIQRYMTRDGLSRTEAMGQLMLLELVADGAIHVEGKANG